MSQAAVVVLWLGTAPSYLYLQPHLQDWAWLRKAEIAAPPESSLPQAPPPLAVGREIEQLLEQARMEASSNQQRNAIIHLRRAARLAERAPELPHAAWLLAECLHAEASIHERDPDRAAFAFELRKRARALEGERAEVFGRAPAAPELQESALSESAVSVELTGLRAHDQVFIDGRRVNSPVKLVAGRHHVRVLRGQRAAWAGWVSLESSNQSLPLPIPAPTPCSLDDIGGTTIQGSTVRLSGAISCPHWAVARPAPNGGVQVAECRYSVCGAALPWERNADRLYAGPPQKAPTAGSDLAPWLVGSAGAVTLTLLALWQLGAFDSDAQPAPAWRFEGPPRTP